MSTLMNDPAIARGITLGVADIARQAVMKKGNVNAGKASAVGISSMAYHYFLSAWIQEAVTTQAEKDISMLWDRVVEILGTAGTLYLMEEFGVVAAKDAQVEEGAGGGIMSKKRGKFGKAVALAGIDVFVGEMLLTLIGDSLNLGSDPSEDTAPETPPPPPKMPRYPAYTFFR